MSTGTQYLIVFIILASILGWIVYKLLFKKQKGVGGGCCGCTLAEKCSKPEKGNKRDKRC
ncbi:MAG: FeoB-associated Cys-rich membrane protein [Bacteroides sp.]|nr:FeoB-associated Cys-rich membrane protein [Bacteroides sp.]